MLNNSVIQLVHLLGYCINKVLPNDSFCAVIQSFFNAFWMSRLKDREFYLEYELFVI